MQNNEIKFLFDDEEIKKIFNEILDKLDKIPSSQRTNSISIKIDKTKFPKLFNPSEYNEELTSKNNIIELVKNDFFDLKETSKERHLPFEQKKSAKLIFNYKKEPLLRDYYKRHIIEDKWKLAISSLNISNQEIKDLMLRNEIKIKAVEAKEIAKNLYFLLSEDNRNKSIRHVSAKYFFGISKILDKKQEIIEYCNLQQMPITVLVHAKSSHINNVLFIENLDTYNEAIESKNLIFENYVLIYSSGYKATAKRLRDKKGSKIFFSSNCKFLSDSKNEFLSWFYKEKELKYNLFFWGDFDYSGINILNSLKMIFPKIKAWEYGYNRLLDALDKNISHKPEQANKEQQIEPKQNDCLYTNEKLIPRLKNNLFVDQEYANLG